MLSKRIQEILSRAEHEAIKRQHEYMLVEHLLYSLIREPECS